MVRQVIDLNFKGFDGVLETLKTLPAEVVSKRGGPVKSGLRKGALVILLEAKLNLAYATENLTGDEKHSTGLLLDNLIASRGKPPPDQNGERYLIRVRRKAYKRKGRTVTTLLTGRLLEYGSEKQPAESWLRSAFKAKAQAAIDVTATEVKRGIERIVAKIKKGK